MPESEDGGVSELFWQVRLCQSIEKAQVLLKPSAIEGKRNGPCLLHPGSNWYGLHRHCPPRA